MMAHKVKVRNISNCSKFIHWRTYSVTWRMVGERADLNTRDVHAMYQPPLGEPVSTYLLAVGFE